MSGHIGKALKFLHWNFTSRQFCLFKQFIFNFTCTFLTTSHFFLSLLSSPPLLAFHPPGYHSLTLHAPHSWIIFFTPLLYSFPKHSHFEFDTPLPLPPFSSPSLHMLNSFSLLFRNVGDRQSPLAMSRNTERSFCRLCSCKTFLTSLLVHSKISTIYP